MEGNPDPDLLRQTFLSIGVKERAILVAIFCLIPGLLCVKWDHSGALSFTQVFLPVWITFAGLLSCIWVLRAPSVDDEEDDEETRKQVEELRTATCHLKVVGTFVIILLSLLLVFIVVKP